jgi:hypothetical protein
VGTKGAGVNQLLIEVILIYILVVSFEELFQVGVLGIILLSLVYVNYSC